MDHKPIQSEPPERYCFTVEEFCATHRISRTTYYELKKQGLGPREIVIGSRRLISVEAAAEWREERTEPSAGGLSDAPPHSA